jgi:hypothetical protein
MSYKLADGSMSTDYKIGDKFYVVEGSDKGCVAIFLKDDGSNCPWFYKGRDDRNCEVWEWLKPFNKENVVEITNSLRETIKQLERTIEELES